MSPKKATPGEPKKAAKKAIRLKAPHTKFRALKPDRQPLRVRKNMDMDPAKLEAVRSIFGVPTETEAVDRAFDEIIFEHKVTAGLERLAKTGGLPNVDPEA
jgi:hypothetical protein